MHMSINIATFYTCPGKSAKVPDNLTQCPGIGLKNYGMYGFPFQILQMKLGRHFQSQKYINLQLEVS